MAPKNLPHQSENWSIIPVNPGVLKNESQQHGGVLLWTGLDHL